jgi:DNA-binding CsgD family transcriptional regulator
MLIGGPYSRELSKRHGCGHDSHNTVKTQTPAIYRKLDASSRSQAAARACELGHLEL